MKIDFTKIEVQVSFDGMTQKFDIAEALGNAMMFNGTVIADIGFEDLAKEIYYSKEAVEVPEKYLGYMVQIVGETRFPATIKRYFRDLNKQG